MHADLTIILSTVTIDIIYIHKGKHRPIYILK